MNEVKKKKRKLRNPFKNVDWKDPMVRILAVLLVTITLGTAIKGCAGGISGHKTIMLDAAFGGDNTGYAGIISESTVAEKIVDELEVMLQSDERFTVYRTHKAGTSMKVEERASVIDKKNPDLVLSIQASGSPDVSKSGMTVYADPPSAKTNAKSLKAAQAIAEAFTLADWKPEVKYLYYEPGNNNSDVFSLKCVNTDDVTDYGLETFALMEKCDVPVVIANTFLVTSQTDVSRWANNEGYKKAAEYYYKGLLKACGFND